MTNLEAMRERAREIAQLEPAALALFRYGATYVVSLLALIDFYRTTEREDEAMDVLIELLRKTASADCAETIGKNMLRLGIYWDEQAQMVAAKQPGLTPDKLLDIIRTKI